jgi:hypothetical protein
MADLYVSKQYGNDGWAGTAAAPYKTIGFAMGVCFAADVIHVGSFASQDDADGDFGAWNTPTSTTLDAPITIRGEEDHAIAGGVYFSGTPAMAELDGDDNLANIFSTTNMPVYLILIDLYMHNTTGSVFQIGSGVKPAFIRCHFAYDAGYYTISAGTDVFIIGCRLTNIKRTGILTSNRARVIGNVIDGSTVQAITFGAFCVIVDNFFINCAAGGITVSNDFSYICGNTIHRASGTSSGLVLLAGGQLNVIQNNIITGFTAGAIALFFNHNAAVFGPNAFWNNSAKYSGPGGPINIKQFDLTAMDIDCSADPFTDSAGGDFSVTDELKAKGWPSPDALYSADTYSYLGSTSNTYVDMGAAQKVA